MVSFIPFLLPNACAMPLLVTHKREHELERLQKIGESYLIFQLQIANAMMMMVL
jgi:hypothetical protein